jgi:hypothetical protein
MQLIEIHGIFRIVFGIFLFVHGLIAAFASLVSYHRAVDEISSKNIWAKIWESVCNKFKRPLKVRNLQQFGVCLVIQAIIVSLYKCLEKWVNICISGIFHLELPSHGGYWPLEMVYPKIEPLLCHPPCPAGQHCSLYCIH